MNIEIQKNDNFVSELPKEISDTVENIAKYLKADEKVVIFETMHGFIVKFGKKELPPLKDQPIRLDKEKLKFFSNVKGFRWIQGTFSEIDIGLEG